MHKQLLTILCSLCINIGYAHINQTSLDIVFKAIDNNDFITIKKQVYTESFDIDTQDQDGKTAALYAAEQGNITMLILLIKILGARPDIADYQGNTITRLCVRNVDCLITSPQINCAFQ